MKKTGIILLVIALFAMAIVVFCLIKNESKEEINDQSSSIQTSISESDMSGNEKEDFTASSATDELDLYQEDQDKEEGEHILEKDGEIVIEVPDEEDTFGE